MTGANTRAAAKMVAAIRLLRSLWVRGVSGAITWSMFWMQRPGPVCCPAARVRSGTELLAKRAWEGVRSFVNPAIRDFLPLLVERRVGRELRLASVQPDR